MSRRQSQRRLERRPEREARRPGGAPPPPPRRRASGAPRRRGGRTLNLALILAVVGVIAIVAMLAYAVSQSDEPAGEDALSKAFRAMLDSDPSLPGRYVPPHPGVDGRLCSDLSCIGRNDDRNHFADGQVAPVCTQEQLDQNKLSDASYGAAGVCYHSNPPTSGPHAARPAQFKVLDNPAPKENLVHSMEHGAVIVWYNTESQDAVRQLASWVNEELDRRRLVVMTKYTEMEPDTIALTAWTRLDKFAASEMTKKRVVDFIEEHSRRFNPEGF